MENLISSNKSGWQLLSLFGIVLGILLVILTMLNEANAIGVSAKKNIRGGIRLIEKQRRDSVKALIMIAQGLSDQDLTEKWQKKAVQMFKLYPRIVKMSDIQIIQRDREISSHESPEAQVARQRLLIRSLWNRTKLHSSIIKLPLKFDLKVLDDGKALLDKYRLEKLELENLRDFASEHYYQHLVGFMADSTIGSYKEAYKVAQLVRKFRSSYLNTNELMAVALKKITTTVCVITKVREGVVVEGNIESEFFESLQFEIQRNELKSNPFLKVVHGNVENIENKVLLVIEITNVKNHSSDRSPSKKMITREVGGKNVTGEETIYIKLSESEVFAAYSLINADANKFLLSGNTSGYHRWDKPIEHPSKHPPQSFMEEGAARHLGVHIYREVRTPLFNVIKAMASVH